MATIIKQHNATIVRKAQPAVKDDAVGVKTCNCRVKHQCPLDGACLTRSIVYKATVQTDNDEKDYIGLTSTTFKQRFNAHQQSMRHKKYQHSTALSKYVWSLKGKEKSYNIKWLVHKKAAAYQNTTKRCNLCLAEKVAIIKADKNRSLNKRTEHGLEVPP